MKSNLTYKPIIAWGVIWVYLSAVPWGWAQSNNQPLIDINPPASSVPSAPSVPSVTAPDPVQDIAPAAQPKEHVVENPADSSEERNAALALPDTPERKSLLFIKEEMDLLHKAVAAYERHKSGQKAEGETDDYLSKLGGLAKKFSADDKQVRTFEYPQFYLESLVYHSPEDWVVHISGKELNQGKQSLDNIRVVGIDKDTVSIEWKPVDADRVNTSWAVAKNDTISVEDGGKRVSFILHPNQTFSSYSMRVLEGKFAPVTVEINNVATVLPTK